MYPVSSSRTTHFVSSAALDGLYANLKEHDPEWLAEVFQKRWLEIGQGEVAKDHTPIITKPQEGCVDEQRSDVSAWHSQTALWPFDVTLRDWPSTRPLTEHLSFVRNYDWSTSSLGCMSSWPVELRYIVNLTLTDPRPAALWWGKDRTILYNEGYADILGARHPRAMGKPFDEVWPELIPNFAPPFEKGNTQGIASAGDNALFMTDRNGYREELWASWNIIPVPAENGSIGFFNPVVETTRQALTDRRLSTLLRLGQSLATATDLQEFWKLVVHSLRSDDHDVPFAAFYVGSTTDASGHATPEWDTDSRNSKSTDNTTMNLSNKHWILQDTLGLPNPCAALPNNIDSQAAKEDFLPNFADLLANGRPTVLSTKDGTFPDGLQHVARSRVFDEPCESAIFCPVGPTHRENVLGFLLLGINPCHQYDQDYDQFVQLLVRQMSTSLASLVLAEEERNRSREDRLRLSAQLAATQQIAVENEHRFRKMADLAPVAMFHCDAVGTILYANDNWFDLTQHPRDAFGPMSWLNVVHEDDKSIIEGMWAKLIAGLPVRFEIRLRKPFVTEDTINGVLVEGDTWIIASAYADKNDDDSVRGILGCLTDISRQKWIESLQARRVEEATELRRQQENFMDMTSHEARNPLSAMTLCAESMLATFRDILNDNRDLVTVSRDTIQTHLEGAEVIMTCAQHQKRIIDDVLTLSKVDSGLLIIAPVEVQFRELVEQALKMLETEFQRGDIATDIIISQAYTTLGIDWVRLDPSRILQVLINLMANAIKFTRGREHRHIRVLLDASTQRPASSSSGIQYLGQVPPKSQLAPKGENDIYLSVVVEDTGTGIPTEELSQLFQRFQQANPKTHVEYGGSGLGLFVCRELVKLQGGDIGVASNVGKGSSFAFFVRSSRCAAPSENHHLQSLLRSANSDKMTHDLKRVKSDKESQLPSDDRIVSGNQILLVEDNLVNQRVMSMQLKRAGFSVSVAHHGAEALEIVRRSRFCAPGLGAALDIILLDIEMPVMDGLTCVKNIRQMELDGEAAAHIPVIAVTANARAEQQAIALDCGMDSVITKPFRMVELLPEIERVRKMHATQ